MPSKGWALFANAKYAGLAKTFIDSLLHFSQHKIYVMAIDCDLGIDSNRIIQEKIQYMAGDNGLFYLKTQCSLKAPFDVVAQVEADMLANDCCDELLGITEELDLPHTLHPIHGQDPNNQLVTMLQLGVAEKSMPYSHATYLFTQKARPFLEKVADAERKLTSEGFYPPNFDETIINCVLWKENAKTQLNCFDPCTAVLPYYMGETNTNVLDGYYEGTSLSWHIFHGNKDEKFMAEYLDKLKNKPLHTQPHVAPKTLRY